MKATIRSRTPETPRSLGHACALFATIWLLITTSTVADAAEPEQGSLETTHLHISWVDGVSAEAVNLVATSGEEFYEEIAELLGDEPPRKIRVLLQGPAETPDHKQRGYPHVDSFAQIHLYQYGNSDSSYISALAHEMVHVFRFNRNQNADWFFEEGFAELIALTVDPSLRGFPWYDTPIVIAAGQWLESEQALPMEQLQKEHKALNLPCKAQAYSLRSAFFHYLADTYGLQNMLKMAEEESAGSLDQYSRYFGKSLKELEAEWQTWTRRQFVATPEHEEKGRRYRTQTPIQYMHICP